jgi:hypothetical protein
VRIHLLVSQGTPKFNAGIYYGGCLAVDSPPQSVVFRRFGDVAQTRQALRKFACPCLKSREVLV